MGSFIYKFFFLIQVGLGRGRDHDETMKSSGCHFRQMQVSVNLIMLRQGLQGVTVVWAFLTVAKHVFERT
jgi:hypothetical protein